MTNANKTNKVLIIAEAGVNHNGSMEMAHKLIDVAAGAGVDVIKFQTYITELGMTKNAPKAAYQMKSTSVGETQFDMVKKMELDQGDHLELMEHCADKGIEFLSTAFDHHSIDLLYGLGLKRFKIPSGEITNLPHLRHIGRCGKPIIMSTGMALLNEIEVALEVLEQTGISRDQVTVLHCNTEYPTPMEDVNLMAMQTIRDKLNVRVGYSDHTLGVEIPVAAVALGATVIEKHFTLSRELKGPDHCASLEADELSDMVNKIRNIEKALGSGIKKPSPSEIKNIPIARKSIVAICDIKRGELFTEKNLAVKRPGTGISPMLWDQVLGKTASREFMLDELIEL
jgi:N,N'-diacetyllegionaminate synthase